MYPAYDRHIELALLHNKPQLARHLIEIDQGCSLHHRRCSVRDRYAYEINPDGYTNFAYCPLSAAVLCKNWEIFELLFSLQVDPDCPGVWFYATQDRQMLDRLVQEFIRRNGHRRTTHAAYGLIFSALENKAYEFKLLTSICNVNELVDRSMMRKIDAYKTRRQAKRGEEGVWSKSEEQQTHIEDLRSGSNTELLFLDKLTAFGCIILRDNTDDVGMVRLLLQAGANLHKVATDVRKLPLHLAIFTNQVLKVQVLLDAGAQVDILATGGISRTPLQYAAEIGSYEIVKLLLGRGADPNSPPAFRSGATALRFAAIQGFMGIAELLLSHGADINTPACAVDGRTALEGAAEHGRGLMVQYLLHYGVNIGGEHGAAQLKRAIRLGRQGKHFGLCKYLESLQYPAFTLE